METLFMCPTNQHTEEPQVCCVVFLEPRPINMKSMADEAYHQVVCEDDQDEKNECCNHYPLVRDKKNRQTHFTVLFSFYIRI